MSSQVDLLNEDPIISNQKYVCISFVSPEDLLKRKELYYFQKFLNNWDFNFSMAKFSEFISFISYKYKVDNLDLTSDFEQFIKAEQDKLQNLNVADDFKTFMDNHEENLQKQFNLDNNFQTSVRGIKIRGSYSTQEEAEQRCKILREIDPTHDVFVGPVGFWMPWHPDAYKTNRVEYLEQELNNLMHEKNKNESKAKDEFDLRVKTAKESAIEENKKLAKESGNKLTQNINDKGELIGVHSESNDRLSFADIEKELFDKNDVRLKDDKEIKVKS